MQYIKINKKQMYDLMKKYSAYDLPDIENTEFERVHQTREYCMQFVSIGAYMDRKHVAAYIEFFLGQATLRIICRKDKYDVMLHPALEDIEEFIREDGRDAPWIIRYTKNNEMESFRGTDIEVLKHAEVEGGKRKSQYIII